MLSAELLKLRADEERRRQKELAEITAQVAQLKDAAAEQARTAAAEALKAELVRVRQASVVQERVIRLAPPPIETPMAATAGKSVQPTAVQTRADDSGTGGTSTGTEQKPPGAPADYCSLWSSPAAADTASTSEKPNEHKPRSRQMIVGLGLAAGVLLAILFGGGAFSGDAISYILIDGPPGAEVWVEGRFIGETPLPEIPATVGARQVIIRHPEAGEIRRTVVVDADSPAILTLGAEPEPVPAEGQ